MSQQTPLFIFIGPPGHGKTTARKIFAQLTGLQGGSTSDVIYDTLANHLGVSTESLRSVSKEEMRPKLIEWGDYLCELRDELDLCKVEGKNPSGLLYRGPSALVRALFLSGCRAIDGVRRVGELHASEPYVNWCGVPVFTIWVQRPEAVAIADNTEVTSKNANYAILNDGDVPALEAKIKTMINQLKGPSA